MPQRAKEVYLVPLKDGSNGTFTLKPTSKKNRHLLLDFLTEFEQKTLEIADAMRHNLVRDKMLQDPHHDPELVPQPKEVPEWDEYEFWAKLFRAITEGNHDLVDWEAFDVQTGIDAKNDFLPERATMTNSFLRSLL